MNGLSIMYPSLDINIKNLELVYFKTDISIRKNFVLSFYKSIETFFKKVISTIIVSKKKIYVLILNFFITIKTFI